MNVDELEAAFDAEEPPVFLASSLAVGELGDEGHLIPSRYALAASMLAVTVATPPTGELLGIPTGSSGPVAAYVVVCPGAPGLSTVRVKEPVDDFFRRAYRGEIEDLTPDMVEELLAWATAGIEWIEKEREE